MHVNCALWSSEVYETVDGSLQNVPSAASEWIFVNYQTSNMKYFPHRSFPNTALFCLFKPWGNHRLLPQGLPSQLPLLLWSQSQSRLQGGQNRLLHQARAKICRQAERQKFPRGPNGLGGLGSRGDGGEEEEQVCRFP